MDVVPAFVAIDGAKFPLVVDGGYVRIADDERFPGLSALSYVSGLLITRPGSERVAELTERRSLMHQALSASFVEPNDRDDLGDGVANWTRLAGYPPDLEDAYLVSTTWIRQVLVMPRQTLIRLIEQVGALNDAVIEHRLEARIEGVPEAGPVNPPIELEREALDEGGEHEDEGHEGSAGDGGDADDTTASALGPELTTSPVAAPVMAPASASPVASRLSSDDLLRDVEAVAGQVDELDAVARQGDEPYSNVERNAAAAARRWRLYLEIEGAGLLVPALADQARVTLIRLGLDRLLGYLDAAQALASYLASPERAGRFATEAVPGVTEARVSLDWFRRPSGYHADGVTEHQWLALCEKNFASPLPASSSGSRFVRLCGAMHRLRYRPEVGAAPCLWRAERAT